MTDSIKAKSIKGIAWSLLESASLKIIQFVINVIMARILMPEDYGIVAIIFVFITISQIFIDGGFATALIQDKQKTEKDYSTIYTFNIIIAVICYIVLFIVSPLISSFYDCNITLFLRVQSLTLIIYSFSAIHKVKLTVDVNFKAIAKIAIISAFVSGCVGIFLALNGLGVWALIGQSLIASMFTSVLLIMQLRWKPICFFDINSFKRLFPFGVRLLISNIIDRIYMNLYPIIVGKCFTPTQLGYYSRAEQFSSLPAGTCADIFTRVTFPVMSLINDETELVKVYRKYIRLSSYLIFPILFAVLLLAKPIVLILLTEKWSEIILLLQILCCGFLLDHISSINRNLLYVKGRADLALKLEVVKKVIATVILFSSIPFGLIGICVGKAFYGLLAMLLNSAYTKKLIGVSILDQVKDFSPSLIIGIISVIVSAIPVYTLDNIYTQFTVGGCVFVLIYLLLSLLTRNSSFKELVSIICNTQSYIKKKDENELISYQ